MARSETEAWALVEEFANAVHLQSSSPSMRHRGHSVKLLASEMMDQLGRGVHRNPPLVIFGNPRRHANPLPGSTVRANEKLSNRVYELAYCHVDDGRDYKHKFAPGTQLYTATMSGHRVVVLSRPDGKKLWEDFD